MKNLRILSSILLAVFVALAPAYAQTALTQTSLSAAISSSSATSLKVASATGITAGQTVLYIEDGTGAVGEAVFVNSVSGTTIGVTRGYYGLAAPHISGALVLVGPPNAFLTVDPSGSCTPGTGLAAYTPAINLKTGNQWLCSSITNSWVPGFFNDSVSAGTSAAVASAATMTPSGPLFHVTGTTAITTIGSAVGMGGSATSVVGAPFCIIPDALGSATAGNNIALGTTFVVNKLLCYTFDQTNKKYVPSY